jgi:hypothetical protein
MKIVNRAFLVVKARQAFWDWAKKIDAEQDFSESDDLEGNVYLIDEDFFDLEPLLEQKFKKIAKHEFFSITEDEERWPKPFKMEDFLNWFHVEVGSLVIDLEKTNLESDALDI